MEVIVGGKAAAAHLSSVLNQKGKGATLALRDFYPGWEKSGCRAEGGKPLLLNGASEGEALQLFFDDHINHHDAHIVDVRRAAQPSSPPLPIAAVLGIHLIRAEPLLSISSPDYFLGAISEAEAKYKAACMRRRALADALLDKGRVLAQLESAKAAGASAEGAAELEYVPHKKTVELSSDVNAAEDDENA